MNLSQAAAAVAWKAEQEAKKSGDINKVKKENKKRIKAFERYHWANEKKVTIEEVIKNAAREEQIDRLAAYDTYQNDTPKTFNFELYVEGICGATNEHRHRTATAAAIAGSRRGGFRTYNL